MTAQQTALVVLGVLAIGLAADPAAAVQSKCLVKKNKCVSTKLKGVLKCHQTAETPGKPADPNAKDCLDKAREKFDGGDRPAKGCFEKEEGKTDNDCVTFDDTAALEALVDSCVGAFVQAVDPGPIDQSKCGAGKKKCIATKATGLLKCHQKAENPGKPEDPNAKGCIDKVEAKFDGGDDPTKGCFAKLENKSRNDCIPPLGNAPELEELVDSCVASVIAVLERQPPSTTTTTVPPATTTTSTTTAPTTTTSTTTAPTTTTSSTAAPTTTTSSTAAPTTTTSSTTTTTAPTPVCGNNVLEAGEECDDGNTIPNDGCTQACTICGNNDITFPETCDDGNLLFGDNCPDTCQIQQCVPSEATQSVTIVSSRPDLTSIFLLVDYPDGRIELPGLGFDVAQNFSDLPGESFEPLDLEYAVQLLVSASFPFGTTTIARANLRGCEGQNLPTTGDYRCIVLTAGDSNFMPVTDATCTVTIP